jgi:hypothetical protein
MGRVIPPFGAPAFPQHGGFGAAPAFPHQGFGAQALSVPSVVCLITSFRPDFDAHITNDLWATRVRARQNPHRGVLAASPVGYVDHIQLDAGGRGVITFVLFDFRRLGLFLAINYYSMWCRYCTAEHFVWVFVQYLGYRCQGYAYRTSCKVMYTPLHTIILCRRG